MQTFRELQWVELGYFMVEDNNKTTTKQLIDFRGYPSPQLELELSWQVGAKVDQWLTHSTNIGLAFFLEISVFFLIFGPDPPWNLTKYGGSTDTKVKGA